MKVEYIDHMGSDLSVVNAARVSFSKTSTWAEGMDFFWTEKGWMKWVDGAGYLVEGSEVARVLAKKDEKLINYLAKHDHFTPFCHPQIQLRVTAPIFVARQWFRSTVGVARNEVSRRYVDDEPEFFMPEEWRSRPDGSIKQGSGGELPLTEHMRASDRYNRALERCIDAYQGMLRDGVAPEQARMILPQSMETQWIETGSLAYFARICKQRLDDHAQKEIRDLAKQVNAIVAPLFPVSWLALMGD